MSEFSDRNLFEYSLKQDDLKTHVCVCCLDRTGPFVSLGACTHMGLFANIFKEMLVLDTDMAVCVMCHRMLAKFDQFRLQVKENLLKLSKQTQTLLQDHKLNNQRFSISPPIIITIPSEEISDNKNIPVEFDPVTEVKTECMNEADKYQEDIFSDEEYSMPLSQVKKELSRNRIKTKAGHVSGIMNKIKYKSITHKTAQFEEKYKGKICLVTLTLEDVLAERESDRIKDAYTKLMYKCTDCIRGYDHEATLNEHKDKYHTPRVGSVQCELCKCYLASGASFKEHNRRHFKRYECVRCCKRNNTLQAVISHYNECHGDTDDAITTDNICHECGVTCKSYRAYRYHLEKHKDKVQCSECNKTFVSKHGLKTHMLTIHKKSSRVYSCTPCNKVYKAKSGWMLHMNSHHKDSKAYCVLCRTHYKSVTILRMHLKTHSRHVNECDKQFVCSECGEKYLTRPLLTEHIKWTHLKEAVHCTICSKMFKNKYALRKHTKFVHEHKRPPRNKMCDYCGRGFTTLQILRSHVRTHTGERPFQCQHCDAAFAHPSALYTHNKQLHAHAKKGGDSNAENES